MLRFCSLASGSSGNATLVEAHDGLHTTRVLVDCGLGQRQLEARLAALGLNFFDLDAIFITHEHGDHLGCALPLAARYGMALWMSAGTHAGAKKTSHAQLHHPRVKQARADHPIAIGALQLHPFAVPHDTPEPLQLVCSDGTRKLGILTDLGHFTRAVRDPLEGCHALLLESNHDSQMLAQSAYPASLKRRVAGPQGHLSNDQAAQALAQLQHAQLRHVVAAHLSERNNRPELVQRAFSEVLGCPPSEVLVSGRHGLEHWLSV